MRKHLLAAGIAAAAMIPTLAFAQQSCDQQRDTRVIGTVAGAGIGALLGNTIAGRGDRTAGTIIGGVGGAVVGNQLTKPNADCAHAYGYYDRSGMWHANAVERANAAGYFDRNGAWVEGAPNGYYASDGRWVAASAGAAASGYYDGQNRWVPASASGYYDTNGQLISGAAPGYYDTSGRWIAGPAMGRYDVGGRWVSGQASGRRDANGVWIADPQPGYYDEGGRWRPGQVTGYYDAQGRWYATGAASDDRRADDRGQDRSNWAGAPDDVRSRVAWLDQRVRRASDNGSLSRRDANRALRSLAAIRQEEQNQRHYRGRLAPRDEQRLMAKLDDVNDSLRRNLADNRRNF